ncbi:hypothetical protein F9L33_04570 [Amylibacter sp. SFDW26]|uniref:SspB family protein n=1 Tax=Amylibacter sp. SFDW26 TaxID=2652722 RepID=UPI001261B571|nr:ClpXP protease specificity-enhancing factor SspB [Amylibacter sp. SFDW26]KAB7616040.1 hypothetical protein F9L33_04570 [Amylibacter sp. SFDW26]
MTDTIDYGKMMHNAMRGLMADLLRKIAKDGSLPGEHHFFICFDTNHPGVDIADWLRDRYPEEMTIVIQHWFENLTVLDDRFSITLNFNDSPEPLVVPYDAIKTFVDPSVEFGLRFEEEEETYLEEVPESPMIMIEDEHEEIAEEKPKKEAEIVSLDSFRKE